MSRIGNAVFRALIGGMTVTKAYRVVAPFYGGIGALLMFHRVRAAPAEGFDPAAEYRVDPAFLEDLIAALRGGGYDIVSKSEAVHRLMAGQPDRKFVCLTFDDGYADNYHAAFDICRRNDAPMIVYLTSGYLARTAWPREVAVEEVVARVDRIAGTIGGVSIDWQTHTAAQKTRVYQQLLDLLKGQEKNIELVLGQLSAASGLDVFEILDKAIMTWDMAREMANSGLVEFGGHSVTHRALKKLGDAEARAEITNCCNQIEQAVGVPVRHFAYPFGKARDAGEREYELCAELGLESADTTRPGTLHTADAEAPYALPRISIDTLCRTIPKVRCHLSGFPAALANRRRSAN